MTTSRMAVMNAFRAQAALSPAAANNAMRRSTRSMVDRVQLAPLLAAVGFQAAAGPIINPVAVDAFVDNMGLAAASGIVQTRANHTHGGGASPAGARWHLLGLGCMVANTGAAQATIQDMRLITSNIAIRLQLGEQTQELGRVENWPAGCGVETGVNNGVPSNEAYNYFATPVIVNPNTRFSMNFELMNAIGTVGVIAADVVEIVPWFRRTIDYELASRTGA